MKLFKGLALTMLALSIGIAAMGCSSNGISAAKGTFTAAMQSGAGNEGSYKISTADWNALTKTKATFKFNLNNLETGDKYSRVVKLVSAPDESRIHLLAQDTVEEETTVWDVLNNFAAIKQEPESAEIAGGKALYDALKDDYTGYWGVKTGNVKAANSATKQDFYFIADKAGTYKITIDIVDYDTADVLSSHTVKFNVK